MKRKILFTCVGTSDPVRSFRDGPWLHIMRHYRPEVVYVFLSAEMVRKEREDQRCEKTIQFIRDHWAGYQVEYHRIDSEIEDASDMDLLDPELSECIQNLVRKYPEDEILLNLSSGTPQMDEILTLVSTDEQYKNVFGIQVKNPEKKAGTSERTHLKGYIPEEHLELNEDEEPGMPNRCVEPKLLSLKKQKRRDQIRTLIQHFNYSAVSDMRGSLPPDLMSLVRHLDARFHLNDVSARTCGRAANVPFSLYPCYQNSGGSGSDYHKVSEYYLTIRNLQAMGRFTDYVLRLNPFVIRLQRAALELYLGYPLRDITTKRNDRVIISRNKLMQRDQGLLSALDQALSDGFRDSDMSIYVDNLILERLSALPSEVMELFRVCGDLNQKRNVAAHELADITDQAIRNACGKTSLQINRMIERCIPILYPECNPSIFHIYEKCNEYILSHY